VVVVKQMLQNESVVAVFSEYQEADAAVKKLAKAGVKTNKLSVVGRAYHSDEKIVGFYNAGDRIKFWGKRGAFWGGLWDWFGGGVSLTLPSAGPLMILGYLAPIVVSAVDGAVMAGSHNAFGAALYSIGVPRDSVAQYEQAVKADGFLVIVHGAGEELARAQAILAQGNSSRVNLHDGLMATLSGPRGEAATTTLSL
jgi:hypothetical protein